MNLSKREYYIAAIGYFVGFTAGAFAGYYDAKQRAKREYEALAKKDLEDAIIYEERIKVRQESSEVILPRVSTRVTNEERDKMIEKELSEEPEEPPVDTDYPYVIPYETVFHELDDGYEDVTLTWYEEDGVLIDSRDEAIPDVEGIVGEANLQKFGHGSRDPNIVYIRNEELQTDFEIVRDSGSYVEKVLGVIKHSESRSKKKRPQKFRKEEW
jgi:hypothetical protein